MGNDKKKATAVWQKAALSALCIFLALVLILMIFATAFVNRLLNRINRVPNDYSDYTLSSIPDDDVEGDITGPSVDASDVTLNTQPNGPSEGDRTGIVSILLVGQDRIPGEGRQRSDSMMLISFNTNTNEITMISFLRDTYVSLPGRNPEKLNAAYAWGGFKLLNETLAVNFGVHVDANVEVDFEGFVHIIDLLGGVDINLTQKEAEYMNRNWGFTLTPGMTHMDGYTALFYSRIREIDSDAHRTGRQRTVITTLIDKYKNKSVAEMLNILDQILPLITTDMSNDQIIDYLWMLFPILSSSTIGSQQIPVYGTYENMNVGNVVDAKVITDMEANREILKNILENP